jgi:predicted metal-dependent hydrolase
VSVTVYPDLRVIVSIPTWGSEEKARKFAESCRGWIEGKLAQFKKNEGKQFLYAGGGKREYQKYKEVARKLVHERLEHFNKHYGFKYGKVAIRNQKSRWGSCSKKGNLNFNYKIALLPPELADYLVVHELCHLGQFNHSRAFWGLVSKAIPDYEICRKKLRN